jgi:hypothetical protein
LPRLDWRLQRPTVVCPEMEHAAPSVSCDARAYGRV